MSDSFAANANEEILTDLVTDKLNDPKGMSLETLVFLINSTRLKSLHDQSNKELTELKKRQDQVSELHSILKKINSATNDKGEFDCTNNEELKKLLIKAKELGADINSEKYNYTKDERDRLVENLRMSVEDLNVLNDMQLQALNRLTNERYESYQLARNTLKPLHDAKMKAAQSMGGR